MSDPILSNGVFVGYDHEPFAMREREDQKFMTWFNKPSRKFGTLRQESILAAKEVREKTDKEIVVLYSGGMDSEWILESFCLANIKVTPLIVRYNGLNDNDIAYADKYVQRRNLIPLYYDLDLEAWYNSAEQKELAWNTQTIELAYTTQMKAMVELNDGNRAFITGYDEPGMIADDGGERGRQWFLMYHERHYSIPKLFKKYGLTGVPNWGRYSPELFGSYVTTPIWQMLAANLYNPLFWSAESLKISLFRNSFPFMEARTKYTGFESSLGTIVTAAKNWQKEIKEKQGYSWNQEWRRNIMEVWEDLRVQEA